MTKDEALKIALEALETALDFDIDAEDGYYLQAITAIKEALAQPEQEPVAWADLKKEAQQIVESKFLWKKFIDGTPLSNDIACWMADFVQSSMTPPQPKQEPAACPKNIGALGMPVNVPVTPPQRTWVELTDEDRQAAFESMPDMLDGFLKTWGWLHFSKAIEAKLKQKNGYAEEKNT